MLGQLPPYYHDIPQDLPDYDQASSLIDIVDLKTTVAPEGAAKYVRTKVHVVERANGSTGYQVVNEMAPGVSLLPIDIVSGHAYAILVDQMRYPHLRPQDEDMGMSLDEAAQAGRIGRWSREVLSGGANPSESLEEAALREGAEEAGIVGLTPDRVRRLFPTLGSSVSVNRQPFNLFYARLKDGEFQPQLAYPDLDEGNMHIGAYRLDTAVPEMIENGTVWELSTVLALTGLHLAADLRKYL